MNWDPKVIQKIEWNGEITNLEQKKQIVQKVLDKVKNGDVIGFGSGSTSLLATYAIAEKIKKEGLNIWAIPTSYEIELLCHNLGIKVTNIKYMKPSWGFDGADEVTAQNWLIKGRGGALFKEKMIMSCSAITYILIDDSKYVENICDKFPIPVECHPDALHLVKEEIFSLGASSIELRLAKGKDGPIITESGNLIIDVKFDNVNSDLEKQLKNITGVIETGLFIGYNIEVLK